jgi:hypothetical protein
MKSIGSVVTNVASMHDRKGLQRRATCSLHWRLPCCTCTPPPNRLQATRHEPLHGCPPVTSTEARRCSRYFSASSSREQTRWTVDWTKHCVRFDLWWQPAGAALIATCMAKAASAFWVYNRSLLGGARHGHAQLLCLRMERQRAERDLR